MTNDSHDELLAAFTRMSELLNKEITLTIPASFVIEALNSLYFSTVLQTTLSNSVSDEVVAKHLLPVADALLNHLSSQKNEVLEEIRKVNQLVDKQNEKHPHHRHCKYFSDAFLIFIDNLIESRNIPRMKLPKIQSSADVN